MIFDLNVKLYFIISCDHREVTKEIYNIIFCTHASQKLVSTLSLA